MPVEEKTLKETISSGYQETTTPDKTQETVTSEGISDGGTEETKTGEPSEPEYISGIDISDVPVQDRPRIKEFLSKKAALLEKGYQPKYQEVAKFKKAQEELISAGLSVEEAQQVLVKHLEQKRNPQPQTKEDKKMGKVLDNLLEASPAEQKEALRQLRQITQEEAGDSPVVAELKKELLEMKKIISSMQGKEFVSAKQKAESDLETLKGDFGKELVEKYKDTILSEWAKNTNIPVESILYYVDPAAYKQALLANKKQQTQTTTQTKEKINASSSPGSGITATREAANPNQSLKSVLREAFTAKK